MRGFLVRWFVNTLALFVVAHIVKGIVISDVTAAFVAALVLGILNAFLRPLIILITLPINLLSWGLFTFVINGCFFYLASRMVRGFDIAHFGTAILGALLFSAISFMLSLLVDQRGTVEVRYIKDAM